MKNTIYEVKPLLRTPRPYPGESLKGLLVRATEENCYYTAQLLVYIANIGQDGKRLRTRYSEGKWKNLSCMLNLDIPTLHDLACIHGIEGPLFNMYNIFGQRIHKYSVRKLAPKICPGCLREQNYARKIWDLAAFTCCPKHKTLLIDTCPKCGRTISWKRAKVSVCGCGQDWRDVELPEVPEQEMILSKMILKACGLWESDETIIAGKEGKNLAGPLSAVSLNELLCAVYFIAGQQHGVVDATGKHYIVKLPHKERHEVLTKAVAVFKDWPENFFKLLDECRGKNYNGERHSGLYKDFGKLYDPLFIRKGNPLPDFLREAFKKYITTTWDGGYAGWCGSLSAQEREEKKYMTREEVTRYLHVSLATVSRLYKKDFLKGSYQPWVNRNRITIDANSVKELKERWDKSITAAEAGDMLGIGKISPGEPKDMAILVGFHKAIQKLSKLKLDVGAFVRMILDEKITPREKGDGTGLSSLLFSASEIKQLSMAESIERRGGKRTMDEAIKQLHTGFDVVYFLIRRGLLVAEQEATSRSPWVILQEEIDRFKNTYCTAGQIARACSTSSRWLSRQLMVHGIMPVTGPKIDGGRNYFYRKADLEGIDFSAILVPKKRNTMQEMNEKGLVNVKQLADMVGCSRSLVTRLIRSGKIVPDDKRLGVGKGNRLFFSPDQNKKLRKLIAEEKLRLRALYERQLGMPLAA